MNSMLSSRRARARMAALGLLAIAIAYVVAPAGAAQAATKAAPKGGPTQAVDINKATAAELTAIPGIGETIARRIVEFREKEGPFRRVEDLMKVKGIGEKSLQRIRPYVKVESKG